MILLILALIWAAALLPPLIRSRMEGNPVDSVGRFRRHLRVLESATPAASALANHSGDAGAMPVAWAMEARRLRLLRRRQQVARTLLAIMGSTLVLGLVPSLQFVLVLHVLVDVAFVAYIAMLAKARTEERRRRVTAVEAAGAETADEPVPQPGPTGVSQAY